MSSFTEPELATIIAGLRHIQGRLSAIEPTSAIGIRLTNNGEYPMPTADDLKSLIIKLSDTEVQDHGHGQAIDAIVRIVVLNPESVFTAKAIQEHGYHNLLHYVDEMLTENNNEALISQEVMLVTGPRPLTEEEHDVMYGDPLPQSRIDKIEDEKG